MPPTSLTQHADAEVHETQLQFVENIKAFVNEHLAGSEFFSYDSSHEQSLKRVHYLKHLIADQGGHRLFYVKGQAGAAKDGPSRHVQAHMV